jgi:hypothetical protein
MRTEVCPTRGRSWAYQLDVRAGKSFGVAKKEPMAGAAALACCASWLRSRSNRCTFLRVWEIAGNTHKLRAVISKGHLERVGRDRALDRSHRFVRCSAAG